MPCFIAASGRTEKFIKGPDIAPIPYVLSISHCVATISFSVKVPFHLRDGEACRALRTISVSLHRRGRDGDAFPPYIIRPVCSLRRPICNTLSKSRIVGTAAGTQTFQRRRRLLGRHIPRCLFQPTACLEVLANCFTVREREGDRRTDR